MFTYLQYYIIHNNLEIITGYVLASCRVGHQFYWNHFNILIFKSRNDFVNLPINVMNKIWFQKDVIKYELKWGRFECINKKISENG